MAGRGPGNVQLPPPQEAEEIEKVTSTTASTATSPGEFSLSPGSVDRVFPIRSVIEQTINTLSAQQALQSASAPPSNSDGVPGSPARSQASSSARLRSLPDRRGVEVLIHERNNATLDQATPEVPLEGNYPPRGLYTTNRHKHVETQDGHMVITGVAGSEQLQRCEDEPIHIPGAVQKFGCLVAFKRPEDLGESEGDDDEELPLPNLDIRVVSENTEDIIGYSPHDLFTKGDFCKILSDEETNNILDHIDYVLRGDGPRKDGPEVFQLSIIGPDAALLKVWCSLHIPEGNADLVICELELEDDNKYPVNNGPDEGLTARENTLGYEPPEEVLTASSTSLHKPLRKLRNSRRRKGQDVLEVFNTLAQIQEQMTSAETLEQLMNVTVGITKELTGFHRIMIYQFDEASNGKVVAELIQKGITCDLYMGLHFPASDIPAQARELYKINKVRLLYDREHETARLICKTLEDLQKPLDLTHSQLRAMSPIHVKYLKHMGVRASMSISLTAFGQLWGLISCHSYLRGMRVPFPVRKMCRLVGENASRNIERISMSRRLYTRLINVNTEQNPSGYFVANSDDLLKLFDADCGLLSIRDETKVMGTIDDSQESLALLEYLRMKNFPGVTHSRDLKKDFPDLMFPPGFKSIAGLMLVPLSSSGDFIVFFRKPQLTKVKWAGNPHEKETRPGTEGYLEPRRSFALWTETVVGKSQEWTLEQTETAAVLCLVYGKFIAVWRQKEAALKSSQLTRLLLANASHEVRTPLNAIINYLEIALEGPLDNGTRENLVRSHSASKSLIYVINDLLDLTRTEGGRSLIQEEEFDLRQTIHDAVSMFKADAYRKGLQFEVQEYAGLPVRVKGDPKRIRKSIQNLAANALKYTSHGNIKVEAWSNSMDDGRAEIEIAVQDTGVGMSPDKVDILFKELEQTEDESDPQREEDEDALDTISKNSGQKMLGLGLAVVARTIRILKGQLKVNSVEGRGSRFTISIPVEVCEYAPNQDNEQPQPGSITSSPTLRPAICAGSLELLQPTRTLRSRASTGTLSIRPRSNSTSTIASEIDRLMTDLSESQLNSPGAERPCPVSDLTRTQSAPKPGLPSIAASPPLTRPPLQHRSSSKGVTATYTPAYEKRSYFGADDETQDMRPQIASISPALEKVLRKHRSPPISPTSPRNAPHTPPQPIEKLMNITNSPTESSARPPVPPKETSPAVRVPLDPLVVPSGAVVPRPPSIPRVPSPPKTQASAAKDGKFSVLVAEDDPINSRIIKKRLEKMGHHVVCHVNGLQCLEAFMENPDGFDAVLMDMQMPIMDGATSTARIRAHESTLPASSTNTTTTTTVSTPPALGSPFNPSPWFPTPFSSTSTHSPNSSSSSAPPQSNFSPGSNSTTTVTTTTTTTTVRPMRPTGRIPIIAVSASLIESKMPEYKKIGFDGWMLKPIDFRRMGKVLDGIREKEARKSVEYREGEWLLGGWFRRDKGR